MKRLISVLLCLALCMGVLTMAVSAAGSYYVAGTAKLCGSEWSCNDAKNIMTDNGDGTYTKTFNNVPAGKHEFKITDGTWDNSWNGGVATQNYIIELSSACDVTITFTASTGAIAVKASGLTEVTPTVVVAGSAGLCNGMEWDVNASANLMTDKGNGNYTWTAYNIPAGYYEFKVVDTGNWIGDPNATNEFKNYVIELQETQNVTITYNKATGSVSVSKSAPTENPNPGDSAVTAPEIVTMTVRGEGVEGLDWENGVTMEEIMEGFYEFTFENVSNTTLKIKFAANGNWDDYNFGGSYQGTGITSDAAWFGDNIEVQVGENANVCVQLDLSQFNYASKQGATFAIHVEKAAVEEPTDEPAGDEVTEPEETPGVDVPGNNDEKPANNGMGWIIAVVIIVVLAGGGVAAFLIIRKKKQQ
jgi:hypothetical protein